MFGTNGLLPQDVCALFFSEITQSDQSEALTIMPHHSTGVFLVTLMAETIDPGIIAQFKAASNPAQSESQAQMTEQHRVKAKLRVQAIERHVAE